MAASDQDVKVRLLIEGGNTVGVVNQASEGFKKLKENVEGAAKAGGELNNLPMQVDKLAGALDKLKNVAAGYLAYSAIKSAANELIQSQIHFQQIQYTLQAAAGSAEGAAEEFKFLADTSNRLGVSLEATSETYGTFLVSAKAAHVSLQETHNIFLALSEASTVFHLSQQKVHSAMVAIEQMMAQGVIRSQELRMQLGNAIPGAYENFMNRVKAKGIDFNKAMADGALDVKTYAKDLEGALRDSFKQSDVKDASTGLNSELARMQNVIFTFKSSISGGLFEHAAAVTIRQLTDMGKAVLPLVKEMGPIVTTVGLASGAFFTFTKASGMAVEKIREMSSSFSAQVEAARGVHAATLATNAGLAEAALAAHAAANETDRLARAEINTARAAFLAADANLVKTNTTLREVMAKEASALSSHELAIAENNVTLAEDRRLAASTRLTAAINAKKVAEQASVAATAQASAAQVTLAGSIGPAAAKVSLLSGAMGVLSTAAKGLFAFLGGWPGLLMAAGAGIAYVVTKQSEEEKTVERLTEAYKELEAAKSAAAVRTALPKIEAEIELANEGLEASKDRLVKLKEASDAAKQAQAADLGGRAAGSAAIGFRSSRSGALDTEIQNIERTIKASEKLIHAKKELLKIEESREEVAHKVDKAMADVDKQQGEITQAKKKLAAAKEKNNEVGMIKAEAEAARKALSGLSEEMNILAQQDLTKDATALAKYVDIMEKYSAAWTKINDTEKERIKIQRELDALENAQMAKGLRKSVAEALKEFNAEADKNLKLTKTMVPAQREFEETMAGLTKQYEAHLKEINKINDKNGGFILGTKERTKATKDLTDALAKNAAAAQAVQDKKDQEGQTRLIQAADERTKQVQEDTKAMERQIGELQIQNSRNLLLVATPAMDAHEARVRAYNHALAEELKALKKAKDANTEKGISDAALTEQIEFKTKATEAQIQASFKLATLEKEAAEREGKRALLVFDKQTERDLMGDQTLRAKLDRRDQAAAMVRATGIEVGTPEFSEELERVVGLMDKLAESSMSAAANFREMGSAVGNTIGQMLSVDWVDAAQNGFDKVAASWAEMLKRMAADLIRSQIMKAVTYFVNLGMNALFGSASSTTPPPMVSGGGDIAPGQGMDPSELSQFASGGHVRGPGSATSDSIPTMLSNGEYVMQASAVAQYGLDFMDALNAMSVRPPRRLASGGSVSGATGSGLGTQVNVINNTGQPSTTETRTGPKGDEIVDIIIGKIANDVRRNGAVGRAIETTFGATRKGVR